MEMQLGRAVTTNMQQSQDLNEVKNKLYLFKLMKSNNNNTCIYIKYDNMLMGYLTFTESEILFTALLHSVNLIAAK